MFTSTLTLVLLAASSLAAPLRSPRAYKPATYREDILEQYADYHARYTALSCQDNHGKDFFETCCHPLLKGELLSSRPVQCTPSAPASSSAVVVESSISISDDGCGDEESTSINPPASTSAVQATTTSHSVVATTSVAAPIETTSKTLPPKTTTKTSSTAQPSQTSGGGGEVFKGGFATFFYQGGVAGACGTVHSDSDLIVAMDERRYGNPGQKSALCGKKVQIKNTNNGKTVIATVADDCPTCTNNNSIDLSSGTFAKIASYDDGMVPIEWSWV